MYIFKGIFFLFVGFVAASLALNLVFKALFVTFALAVVAVKLALVGGAVYFVYNRVRALPG